MNTDLKQAVAQTGAFTTPMELIHASVHMGCTELLKHGVVEADYTDRVMKFLSDAPEVIVWPQGSNRNKAPLQVGVHERNLYIYANIEQGAHALTGKEIVGPKTWKFTPEELEALPA